MRAKCGLLVVLMSVTLGIVVGCGRREISTPKPISTITGGLGFELGSTIDQAAIGDKDKGFSFSFLSESNAPFRDVWLMANQDRAIYSIGGYAENDTASSILQSLRAKYGTPSAETKDTNGLQVVWSSGRRMLKFSQEWRSSQTGMKIEYVDYDLADRLFGIERDRKEQEARALKARL